MNIFRKIKLELTWMSLDLVEVYFKKLIIIFQEILKGKYTKLYAKVSMERLLCRFVKESDDKNSCIFKHFYIYNQFFLISTY